MLVETASEISKTTHTSVWIAQNTMEQELIELIPRAHAHFSWTWYRGTEVALWKMTAIAVLNIEQHKTH